MRKNFIQWILSKKKQNTLTQAVTIQKQSKGLQKKSSSIYYKDPEDLKNADENRKKLLNKWAEENKKEKFDYIFNEIAGKIKTIKLTTEIKEELETLCKEIYYTGYKRGVKEGILD